MAFVGLPCDELPANQPKSARPYVPGVGPGTAQYGGVWPNEWPNGQRHGDIERRCVAPVTIEMATGASGGRRAGVAVLRGRARRQRPTACRCGCSMRHCAGARSQHPLGNRRRRRPAAAGAARACRSWRPRALPAPDERWRFRPPGCERDLERGVGDRSRRRSGSPRPALLLVVRRSRLREPVGTTASLDRARSDRSRPRRCCDGPSAPHGRL
jgi:hypothetical protein